MSEKIRPEPPQITDHRELLVVCAWCGAVIREGRPPVSHGICPTCTAIELPAESIASISAEDLDRLPFGIIQLSGDGVIVGYNRMESTRARRAAPSVVGRNFFTEVAPCTDVAGFHGRLERLRAQGAHGSEKFAFTFKLPWATASVQVALTYDPVTDSAVVIVDWPPEAGARS